MQYGKIEIHGMILHTKQKDHTVYLTNGSIVSANNIVKSNNNYYIIGQVNENKDFYKTSLQFNVFELILDCKSFKTIFYFQHY